MRRARVNRKPAVVTVGFAAGAEHGVAYAALGGTDERPESLVRVGFRCRPLPALTGRDVAYAALQSVAGALLERGMEAVELRVADGVLPVDLAERRTLPSALIVPYVTLRCTLNRFATANVVGATSRLARDLTARARAEASLNVAA